MFLSDGRIQVHLLCSCSILLMAHMQFCAREILYHRFHSFASSSFLRAHEKRSFHICCKTSGLLSNSASLFACGSSRKLRWCIPFPAKVVNLWQVDLQTLQVDYLDWKCPTQSRQSSLCSLVRWKWCVHHIQSHFRAQTLHFWPWLQLKIGPCHQPDQFRD